MKHQCYTIIFALILLGLGSHTAEAQKADTLRRSLTVLTTEAVELSEVRPQTFVLPSLPMRKAQAMNTTPSALGHRSDLLRPSPLGTLGSLPHLLPSAPSLGYVDASLGVKYNGSLSLGMRPIQRLGEQLDLALSGRMTHHSIAPRELGVDIRELVLGLGGRYERKSATHQVSIGAQYEYDKHNYYGLYPIGEYDLSQPNSLAEEIDNLMRNNLITNQIHLFVDTRSLVAGRGGWQYHLTPKLTYTQAQGMQVNASPDYRTGELAPSVALGISRSLSRTTQVGVDVEGRMLFYRNDDAIDKAVITMKTGFENRTFIHLSPYWAIASETDGLRYQIRLGVALDSYRKGDKSKWQIAPEIEGALSWAEWSLRGKVYGDVLTNSLGDMLRDMPYMQVGLQAMPTARPLIVDLRLRGSISPRVALELSAGYQRLRDALNYSPLLHEAGAVHSGAFAPHVFGVSFIPEHVSSASIMTVGGALTYRHDGLWGLTLKGGYKHLSEELLSRPSVTLGASWQWLASDRWNVSIGYDLTSGIKYARVTETIRQIETLRPMQVVSARGGYRISQLLSLRADAQYQIGSEARLYPYYQPQDFVFNLGATLTF